MKIFDISWPITDGMQEYKDRKSVKITQKGTIETGGSRNFELCMNNHTGTHVDGPSHMLPTGKNISELGLHKLVGTAHVLDCTQCIEKITADDLQKFTIVADSILLLQTRNSFRSIDERFDYSFVYLEASGADYLASKKIKAVGIDYLGIERDQPGHPTHKALLKFDIPIIEGLRLGDVAAGEYLFYCLPLLINDVDSAPARAILLQK